MPSPQLNAGVEKRIEESAPQREEVRKLVDQGDWMQAEPDRLRMQRFIERTITPKLPIGAEAVRGDTADFQGVTFLSDGSVARRAVGYVEVNDLRCFERGTGFLISPRLFLTCQHVIQDANAAKSTQITFDRELDHLRRPKPTTTYLLDPDTFSLFSSQTDLDYAVIAIGQLSFGTATLQELGSCALQDTPDRHVIGMNVNIIQHPSGLPKMIAIRNNILTYRAKDALLYETDTEQGSSGAPVFNDDWEVVALHHWSSPYKAQTDENGKPIPNSVNEGIRISSIYIDLQARLASLPEAQQALLKEALAEAPISALPLPGIKTLSPPHPTGTSEALTLPTAPANGTPGEVTMNDGTAQEVTFNVPLQISVRLGQAAAPVMPVIAVVQPAAETKVLRGGPEALKLDTDYSNRTGYAANFIEGADVPLPALSDTLQKQLAPLRAEEQNAADGELKYEHFSIKINKTRRMAIFAATNIDGETYLNINRKTGQVTSQPEAETWYKDVRISASFVLDQPFYSAWSTYFDHGHLTRRSDPTWGTPEVAQRANTDTFHFTNCTPQHFRFNESSQFWQGVERYVLENGVLAQTSRKRLCVIQGPIFNDKIDLWSDDVQIPSSFFKVVVWKGADSIKAVGLVVDQLPLLSEQRKSLGTPRALPSINVNQWRVALQEIGKRTGLQFSDTLLQADTIANQNQPAVGAEAETVLPIRSFADIKL